VDQSKACSQQRGRDVPKKEKYIPKGENADWIKSTYERRVENRGRNKGERCSQEGKIYSKKREMPSGSSQHMREE